MFYSKDRHRIRDLTYIHQAGEACGTRREFHHRPHTLT